jgi:hypothetical protein
MNDFLLGVMPGMLAKYEYAHALLKWAQDGVNAIKAHHEKSTIGYPTLEPVLLDSLEKVAHDVGSVPLLQYVIKLRAVNDRLKRTNENPSDDAGVIDMYFGLEDEMPTLEAELKSRLTGYAVRSLVFFVVLAVLIMASMVGLARCA